MNASRYILYQKNKLLRAARATDDNQLLCGVVVFEGKHIQIWDIDSPTLDCLVFLHCLSFSTCDFWQYKLNVCVFFYFSIITIMFNICYNIYNYLCKGPSICSWSCPASTWALVKEQGPSTHSTAVAGWSVRKQLFGSDMEHAAPIFVDWLVEPG